MATDVYRAQNMVLECFIWLKSNPRVRLSGGNFDGSFDHTDAGTVFNYSAALNGFTNEIIGPATTIQVMAGDAIDIEVYAKYSTFTGDNSNTVSAGDLIAAIATAFTPTGASAEVVQQVFDQFNALGAGVLAGSPNPDGAPAAYLNYLFFDRDMQYVAGNSGFIGISRSAEGNFEELFSGDLIFDRRGYLYVYVSNETLDNVNVHFDDLKITHRKGTIIQMENYYPFGLTFNSYQRTTTKKNDYLYNGKEMQDDLSLNLYDYQARYYDPALGRFINIDPMADIARRNGVYNYAYNNPLRYIDPDGMVASDTIKTQTDTNTNDSNTDSNTKKRQYIDDYPDSPESDDEETTEKSLWTKVVEFLSPKAGEVLVSGSNGAGPMEPDNEREITTGQIDVDLMTTSGKGPKSSSSDPSVSVANGLGSFVGAISEFFGSGESGTQSSSTTSNQDNQEYSYEKNGFDVTRNAGDVKDSVVSKKYPNIYRTYSPKLDKWIDLPIYQQ